MFYGDIPYKECANPKPTVPITENILHFYISREDHIELFINCFPHGDQKMSNKDKEFGNCHLCGDILSSKHKVY